MKDIREQGGRNADGTFAKGNKPKVTENYGRPTENLSVRTQTKLRVQKNPKLMKTAIDNMFKILADTEHPQFSKMLDTFVKLNGNYDPAETKDVTPSKAERPYKGLTLEEINKLLKRKNK